MVVSTGMEHGASLSYDRLEDLLAQLQPMGVPEPSTSPGAMQR
jgi:hypothetical protein